MKEFDKVFRKILNGVFIITIKHGEKLNGMTAVWVTRAWHEDFF